MLWATEAELAAMTLRDIMSKSEPVVKHADQSEAQRLTQLTVTVTVT